jgi:hypothetical protein
MWSSYGVNTGGHRLASLVNLSASALDFIGYEVSSIPITTPDYASGILSQSI